MKDISHSSAERVIFPDTLILLDFSLARMSNVIKNLVVNKKRMNENLQKSNGLYNSQRVLLSLIKKGLSRETAYKIVQNVAMKSWNQNKSFEKLLLEEEKIKKFLSSEDINNIFDINYHFKFIDKIFKKIES